MNRNRLLVAEIQTPRPSMLHHHHNWKEKEIIDNVCKITNVKKSQRTNSQSIWIDSSFVDPNASTMKRFDIELYVHVAVRLQFRRYSAG